MTKAARVILRFWVSIFLLIGTGLPVAMAAETYTFALLPGAPPVALSKRWTPVIDRLSKESGIEFRLKFFERMADFEREIWNGTADFIYASPIQTVVAHQAAGYIPLVRSSTLADITLYVRQDSPVRNVGDLTGKTISFVGNKNICSAYMQHELNHYGQNLAFEKEYAGSTRNVIINVLMGKTTAGAVFTSEMERESEETRAQLREVVATPKFAPHPISSHPRVPVAVRVAVRSAMLKIAANPDAAAILKPLRLDNLIEADYDRDYRALEKIDIKGLTNWGE
jgi:phosphonate transport system substrate-binding protein